MCEQDNKANHTRQLARDLLLFETTFRNHKETMAHAVLALQMMIFFAWIMREDIQAVSGKIECYLFGLFFLLYLYIRWELRKRRFSGIRIAAIVKALGEWGTNDHDEEESKSEETKYLNGWKLLDLIFPLPLFYIKWLFPPNYMMNSILPDSAAKKYPAPLAKAIQDSAKEKALSWYIGEYLVSLISAVILLIVYLC
jgi:hypothetical protein